MQQNSWCWGPDLHPEHFQDLGLAVVQSHGQNSSKEFKCMRCAPLHPPVSFPLQGIHTPRQLWWHWSRRGEEDQDLRFKNHTPDPTKTPAWMQTGETLSGLDTTVALRRSSGSRKHLEASKSCFLLPSFLPVLGWARAMACGLWLTPQILKQKPWHKEHFLFQTPMMSELFILAVIKRKVKSISQWWYRYWFHVPQAAPWWRLVIL